MMHFKHIIVIALTSYFMSACLSPETEEPSPLPQKQSFADNPIDHDEPISAGPLSGLYRNAGLNSPVILIVPGSGPTDLNGNNPLGVNASTYKHLSKSLSDAGISTVRVDKRGMFSSAEGGDPNAVTVDIYAQDYRNWVEAIRTETGQSCIYMLGHSEGALMVTAASIGNENVCGLILVAGVGRSFGDLLREQLKANPANFIIIKEAFKIIETLERGEHADTTDMNIALRPLFAAPVQDFMISLMQSDPAQMAKEANKKTLIIQGRHDLQVSVKDAEILADATGGRLVIIDGMNHVLKDAPKSRRKNIATYKKPNLPISDGVVEAIRVFIEE